jgi:two-component system sensor histidine kinase/response regulator
MLLDNDTKYPGLDKNLVFLVVDDFETMRRVTINQLRQLGAEKILIAKDGLEALRLLKSQTVHVVVSDWNMPVMNGLELLKKIRSDEKLFTLPFLMITAEAERHRVEEAVACGVTSLLLKPYSANQLRLRLEGAFSWKPRKVIEVVAVPVPVAATDSKPAADQPQRVSIDINYNPGPAPTLPTLAPKKVERPTILIVDDTPDNLLLLSQLLKEDYRIRLAQNGTKALEICTSDNPPDLVLLDIMMPDMDGFEVAKRMRDHPNSENTPVIFVTAMTSADARLQGLDLGAVDFITKPVDPDVLKPRIRNFMRYVQIRKNLQADYDAMIEVAQLRDDVEHITRHDIKGPLAGVLGLVQGMMDDAHMGKQHMEQLRLVEETTLQVLNMINLSSELFKIETNRFELHAVPVNVVDILRRIVEMARATYSGKSLDFSMTTDVAAGAAMPQALGDAMLCYSLFQNLLKNACEAAPDSTQVLVKLYNQSPLRIVIENTGAVPAAIRDRFFDKFITSGKQGGTGLGTYSAKLLTEAQQGSIAMAVSDETNTTAITVSLPRSV